MLLARFVASACLFLCLLLWLWIWHLFSRSFRWTFYSFWKRRYCFHILSLFGFVSHLIFFTFNAESTFLNFVRVLFQRCRFRSILFFFIWFRVCWLFGFLLLLFWCLVLVLSMRLLHLVVVAILEDLCFLHHRESFSSLMRSVCFVCWLVLLCIFGRRVLPSLPCLCLWVLWLLWRLFFLVEFNLSFSLLFTHRGFSFWLVLALAFSWRLVICTRLFICQSWGLLIQISLVGSILLKMLCAMHLHHELIHCLSRSARSRYRIYLCSLSMGCGSCVVVGWILLLILLIILGSWNVGFWFCASLTRGLAWCFGQSGLCWCCSECLCGAFIWLDYFYLLRLYSFWNILVFLPFSFPLSFRFSLFLLYLALRDEFPGHRDINTGQGWIWLELCPPVYYPFTFRDELWLLQLLFLFITTFWIKIDYFWFFIKHSLPPILFYWFNSLWICTLYRLFRIGRSEFSFQVLPLTSAPTFLKLLWRSFCLWILILGQSNWAVVVNTFVFFLSCFKSVIRAIIIFWSDCCVYIWQQILIWIITATCFALWWLDLPSWDDFPILGFCNFKDSVVFFDRAVAWVSCWWNFYVACVAVNAARIIKLWKQVITINFWTNLNIICILDFVMRRTSFTQELIDHLSRSMSSSLPWLSVNMRISLTAHGRLLEQVEHLLVWHGLFSKLFLVLSGLFGFFIRGESSYGTTSWIPLWTFKAFVWWCCFGYIRSDIAAALWFETGSVFMPEDLEVILWVDLLARLRLILLLLFWCRWFDR